MLQGWDNFFIMAGTAGATLIGLLFVAITLGADLSTPRGVDATRAFLTPTLLRFAGVLFGCLAMLPAWPAAWPVGTILGLCRLTGLGYQIHVILKQRKVRRSCSRRTRPAAWRRTSLSCWGCWRPARSTPAPYLVRCLLSCRVSFRLRAYAAARSSGLSLAVSIAMRLSASARVRFGLNASSS